MCVEGPQNRLLKIVIDRARPALPGAKSIPKIRSPVADFFFGQAVVFLKLTVKPALNDHRFKRPPAFSDRFFMHGESAIQTALC